MAITKTKYYSWKINSLPKGCRLCVEGKKTVLFITGVCSKHCFYCPISDKKWQHDDVYANEWKTDKFEDLLEEIRLCSSKGVGITGGDPLCKIDRTCGYIRKLKNKFGKEFHIHLYTPLELVTQHNLKRLYHAGLDEIRFNPDLDKNKEYLWKKVPLAKGFKWDIGIEIPVIPGYLSQTKKLIEYAADKIDFLNLNELEISDSNSNELLKKGFRPKDDLSYAVKGSHEMAMSLLKWIEEKRKEQSFKFNVHYCTPKLKDKVQLRKRIMLRAKNYATEYDRITQDGTLIRNVIYLDELKPGFGYSKKIDSISKRKKALLLRKLKRLKGSLQGIMDVDRIRIITDKNNLKKAKLLTRLSPAIVEEYPTKDSMIVSVEFL